MCCAKVFYSSPIGQFPDSFNLSIYKKASCRHFTEYQKRVILACAYECFLTKAKRPQNTETDFHFTVSSEVLSNVNNYVSTALV